MKPSNLFLLLVISTVLLEYIGVSFYDESGCGFSTMKSQWVIPIGDDGCYYIFFLYTDGTMIRIDYDTNVTFEVYPNPTSCGEGSDPVIVMDIPLDTCSVDVIETYHLKFQYYPEFPVDNSTYDEGWMMMEYFEDEDCEMSKGLDKGGVGRLLYGYKNEVDLGKTYLFSTEYIISYARRPYMKYETMMIPRSLFNGVCASPLFKGSNTKMTCLSDTETFSDEYMGDYSVGSIAPYFLEDVSFNQNCTSSYYSAPFATDMCQPENIYFAITEDTWYQLGFRDLECDEDLQNVIYVIAWRTKEDEDTIFGTCYSVGEQQYGDQMIEAFKKVIPLDDPYIFTNRMANYNSDTIPCGEDIGNIERNPGAGVHYIDEEFCGGTEMRYGIGIIYVSELPNDGKSFKGYCDTESKLNLKVWKGEDCFGEYEHLILEKDYCVDESTPWYDYYDRLMCMNKYCDGISELEEDVCNSRGKCVGLNVCECEDGYTGTLCENFVCYGVLMDDENVCNQNGECVSLDNCVCNVGYTGKECENDSIMLFLVTFIPSLGVVSVLTFLIISLCVGLCCCICSFLILLSCIGLMIFGSISCFQRRRLVKYEELDDFDVILKEQLLEREIGSPKFKIRKELFEVDYDEVKISRIIGKGGSLSIVYLAEWRGNQVAFKCFRTRQSIDLSEDEDFSDLEKELEIFASLVHPNICRFYGAALKHPRIGILMEYCSNGEICNFVRKYRAENNGKGYPIKGKIRMLQDVISAIEYVHSRKIIHRDIKSENILIDGQLSAKLVDFGISKIMEKKGSNKKTKRIGTSFYMAPEVVFSTNYDEKCDSFSFSILMWVVLCEVKRPYGVKSSSGNTEFLVASDPLFRPRLDVVRKSLGEEEGEYEWILEVMEKCWGHDPGERHSFTELKEIFEKRVGGARRRNMEDVEEDLSGEGSSDDDEEVGSKLRILMRNNDQEDDDVKKKEVFDGERMIEILKSRFCSEGGGESDVEDEDLRKLAEDILNIKLDGLSGDKIEKMLMESHFVKTFMSFGWNKKKK